MELHRLYEMIPDGKNSEVSIDLDIFHKFFLGGDSYIEREFEDSFIICVDSKINNLSAYNEFGNLLNVINKSDDDDAIFKVKLSNSVINISNKFNKKITTRQALTKFINSKQLSFIDKFCISRNPHLFTYTGDLINKIRKYYHLRPNHKYSLLRLPLDIINYINEFIGKVSFIPEAIDNIILSAVPFNSVEMFRTYQPHLYNLLMYLGTEISNIMSDGPVDVSEYMRNKYYKNLFTEAIKRHIITLDLLLFSDNYIYKNLVNRCIV